MAKAAAAARRTAVAAAAAAACRITWRAREGAEAEVEVGVAEGGVDGWPVRVKAMVVA